MKDLGGGFSLGWDWNPVAFFVALVVSFVLVAVMKKWRVAWVVPAFVLYFGLEWSLPWEWLFHLVFWVCVIVVIATALLPGRSRLARVPFMMMSTLLAVLLVILAGHGLAGWMNGDGKKKVTETPTSSPSASPTSSATTCTTWQREELDHSNWRVVGEGIAEIKAATTPEQAREAAMVWLDKIKVSPVGFTSAASYLLPNEQVDATMLFDDNGCATETAETLLTKMSMAVGQAAVKPDQAPANGYNSGVSNDVFVVSKTAGIQGDRKAIRIELSNGQVFWVLARCANPVTKHRPPHPPGPTDNPPPKKPGPGPTPQPGPTPTPDKPTCPPGMHGTPPICKDDPSKQPGSDKAPNGSGKNEDPGPGAPNPSPTFAPAPRPTPAPPTSSSPPKGSTPVPTPKPPPPPEPGANPSNNTGGGSGDANSGDPGGF